MMWSQSQELSLAHVWETQITSYFLFGERAELACHDTLRDICVYGTCVKILVASAIAHAPGKVKVNLA